MPDCPLADQPNINEMGERRTGSLVQREHISAGSTVSWPTQISLFLGSIFSAFIALVILGGLSLPPKNQPLY